MIYLKESFNLHPASPATRDLFVEVMQESVVPASPKHGARLRAAWFCHEEWFSQVIQVTEFDDLPALAAYRSAAESDDRLAEGLSRLAELAPERHVELLEPLGPIAPAALEDAIEASNREPVGPYTFAILEVAAGAMQSFVSMLSLAKDALPIVACWRELSGNPSRVIDLWKGDVGAGGYRPNDDAQSAFFEPLRKIAPRERMMRLHPLPHSPLQ